mmetsp:Transcript_62668/g.137029  ORF Transcript_62668/g.137029 Transcript_62668/m.137029 type:complete len:258 (+) Transcript_62668:898-1671(+)
MDVDGPSAIDFSEHLLHVGVPDAGVLDALLGKILDSRVVDFSRPRLTKELGCLSDQDHVHVVHIFLLDCLGGSAVDGQSVAGQAVVFLELRVEHVQAPRMLRRDLVQGLLEEVAGPLQLAATVSGDELVQIHQPDIVNMWPIEDLDTPLIDLESILEVLSLLQELRVAQDEARGGHLHVDGGVVGGSGGLGGAQALLDIDRQGPKLGGAEEAILHNFLVRLEGVCLLLAHSLSSDLQSLIVLPMSELHFDPFAPSRR